MKKILSLFLILCLSNVKVLGAEQRVVVTSKTYTYDQMVKDLQKLSERYKDIVKVNIIGKSEYERNIYEVKLGKGKAILHINGAHHAREWITSLLIMKMIEELSYSYVHAEKWSTYDVKSLLDKTTISFVPMVNPDGVTMQQFGLSAFPKSIHQALIEMNDGSKYFKRWKANAKGVDLNRNYDANWAQASEASKAHYEGFKGTKPMSAKEVASLAENIKKDNPEITVSYHSSGEVIYWKYKQDETRLARDIKIAEKLKALTGYSLVTNDNAKNYGKGFKDWFVEKMKKPGFTIEVSPLVGSTNVPLSYFNSIWKRNKLVPLYLAQESYDLYASRISKAPLP